jgi:hypothetical protein
MSDSDDFSKLDDPAFLAEWKRVRGGIGPRAVPGADRKVPAAQQRVRPKGGDRMGISQLRITTLPRLLAVEVLLAEPEALDDDVLESCLYILRDKMTGKADES